MDYKNIEIHGQMQGFSLLFLAPNVTCQPFVALCEVQMTLKVKNWSLKKRFLNGLIVFHSNGHHNQWSPVIHVSIYFHFGRVSGSDRQIKKEHYII